MWTSTPNLFSEGQTWWPVGTPEANGVDRDCSLWGLHMEFEPGLVCAWHPSQYVRSGIQFSLIYRRYEIPGSKTKDSIAQQTVWAAAYMYQFSLPPGTRTDPGGCCALSGDCVTVKEAWAWRIHCFYSKQSVSLLLAQGETLPHLSRLPAS